MSKRRTKLDKSLISEKKREGAERIAAEIEGALHIKEQERIIAQVTVCTGDDIFMCLAR